MRRVAGPARDEGRAHLVDHGEARVREEARDLAGALEERQVIDALHAHRRREEEPAAVAEARVDGVEEALRLGDVLQELAADGGVERPGEVIYELVAPLAGAPRSPIDRVLEKGNTSYHVCYETPDLEATLARFVAEGALIVSDPVAAVAFEGRRIAWLLLPMRHLLELLEAARPPLSEGSRRG